MGKGGLRKKLAVCEKYTLTFNLKCPECSDDVHKMLFEFNSRVFKDLIPFTDGVTNVNFPQYLTHSLLWILRD